MAAMDTKRNGTNTHSLMSTLQNWGDCLMPKERDEQSGERAC
jgi:hypothetical protein